MGKQISPEHAEVVKTLTEAIDSFQKGHRDIAERLLDCVLAREPNNVPALNLRAVLLHKTGRIDEAIEVFRRITALAPHSAEVFNNLASGLYQCGRFEEAIPAYQTAIRLNSGVASSHLNLGLAFLKTGKEAEAFPCFVKAIQTDSNAAEAYLQLGLSLKRQENLEEAANVFREGIRQVPNHTSLHFELGTVLLQMKDREAALEVFERVLLLKPDHLSAIGNMGFCLQELERYDEAIALFRKVIALNSKSAKGYSTLGGALLKKGMPGQALLECNKALALAPGDAEVHLMLAEILTELDRREEAIVEFEKAIALTPEFPAPHLNRAMLLLQLGKFQEGWKEFEWRLDPTTWNLGRSFSHPRWNGEDIAGQTLLLFTEGGFGDAFHFVRLVALLYGRGATLVLECQPGLVSLFERNFKVDKIIPRGEPLPAFDYQIPLQSLPLVLGITLENIPAKVPYITAPPERVAHWATRIPKKNITRVGLVWAGSQGDQKLRSRSIEIFAPLADLPEVQFFSLQKGEASLQPPPSGFDWVDHTPELTDFAETSALIQNLDLVLTVDTSIAHLSGAMAKPTWVLIPHLPDFRWLLDRTDSPWYPTLRLFRQGKGEEWIGVVERLKSALEEFSRKVADQPENE